MAGLRPLSWAAIASLAAGIALVTVAVLRGEVSGAVVVIFPVLYGSSVSFAAGVGLIFLAVVLAALSSARSPPLTEVDGGTYAETRGVVLLGPVPLFFGGPPPPLRWRILLGALVTAGILALALWAWFG